MLIVPSVPISANPKIPRIIEEEITRGVDGKLLRSVQQGGKSRAGISAEPKSASARHGGDDAVRSDFSNSVVSGIGYVQIAGLVDGNVGRIVEGRFDGDTAIARITRNAIARHYRRGAIRPPADDDIVVLVRDVNISGIVGG